MPDNPTALRAAMQGKKVGERQTKSALSAAVTKIARLTRRAERSKEAMAETGSAVIHTAEANGSLFLASLAEGYFGPDKLKLGSVDLRAPAGMAAIGFGLYETMSGKSTGGHALAIGNGVLGSWLASVATQAGRTLAEKRADPPPAMVPAPPFQLTPAIQGPTGLPEPLPEPGLEGPLREVLLTPESVEGPDWLPRRRRRRRGRPAPRNLMRRRLRRERDDLDDFDSEPDTEEV
ncbi:MAG: hypothetical protein R3F61_11615 [Myxococcota bacterium]